MTVEQFVAEIREKCAEAKSDFKRNYYQPPWFYGFAQEALPRAAEIIEGLYGINKYLMDQLLNVRVRADTSRIGATRWLADILTGEQATTNREQEGASNFEPHAVLTEVVGPDAPTGRSQPQEATLAHGGKEDHT